MDPGTRTAVPGQLSVAGVEGLQLSNELVAEIGVNTGIPSSGWASGDAERFSPCSSLCSNCEGQLPCHDAP